MTERNRRSPAPPSRLGAQKTPGIDDEARAGVAESGLGEDPLAGDDVDPLVGTLYPRPAPRPVPAPVPPSVALAEEPASSADTFSFTDEDFEAADLARPSLPALHARGQAESRRSRSAEARRQPLPEGKSYRLVTFSFYEEDVERLDALLAEARRRGHKRTSRSQIVRLALRQVNLEGLPEDL